MKEYYEELIIATDLFGKVNTKLAGLPNPYILTYVLEAVDTISSNEIEDIHTTVDEAYQGYIEEKNTPFHNYREALKNGHKRLINMEIIRINDIKKINKRIRGVDGEFRKGPVSIKDGTGKIIHQPIDAQKVPDEMNNLIEMINQDRIKNQILLSLDVHHKFEWIHPFSDGNGRTGRILFALLLSKYEILNVPASVFSYSIARSKGEYYKALKLADRGNMNEYYKIMLSLLNQSLKLTLKFIERISRMLESSMDTNKKKSSIIEYLFGGVKTSNNYIVNKTGFNNKTVSKYIDVLIKEGMIEKQRHGKYVSYKNLYLEKLIIDIFNDVI